MAKTYIKAGLQPRLRWSEFQGGAVKLMISTPAERFVCPSRTLHDTGAKPRTLRKTTRERIAKRPRDKLSEGLSFALTAKGLAP